MIQRDGSYRAFATMAQGTRSKLLTVTKIACGVLALALFRWTPTTGRGILVYAALFAGLILIAIVLSSGKRGGYWPKKPEDQ
jgi:hypothetical protein